MAVKLYESTKVAVMVTFRIRRYFHTHQRVCLMFRITVRQPVRLRLRCVGDFGLRLVALPTNERMFDFYIGIAMFHLSNS